MDKLTHHCADDQCGWFAGCGQTSLKAFPPGGLVERDHCGHVKGFAQEGMADLGQPGLALVLLAHLAALAGLRPQPQNLSPETLPEPMMVSLLSAPQATSQNSEPPSHPEQKMQRIVKPKAIKKKLTKHPAKPTTAITNKTFAEGSQNTSRLSVEQEATPEAEANSPPNAISGSPKTTKPPVAGTSYQPPNFNAAYLHNPAPHYPSVSKRLGEQGRVLLRVQVSADDGRFYSPANKQRFGAARPGRIGIRQKMAICSGQTWWASG